MELLLPEVVSCCSRTTTEVSVHQCLLFSTSSFNWRGTCIPEHVLCTCGVKTCKEECVHGGTILSSCQIWHQMQSVWPKDKDKLSGLEFDTPALLWYSSGCCKSFFQQRGRHQLHFLLQALWSNYSMWTQHSSTLHSCYFGVSPHERKIA